MEAHRSALLHLSLRTMVVHTVTYSVVGMAAFFLLDYSTLFSEPGYSAVMRPVDDPLVVAGSLFQPIRGLLFGIVLYLLRDSLFKTKEGWLVAWVTLVILGIVSTFGPSPGSLEGLVYTTIPVERQLLALPEVMVQSFLLAGILFYWVNHPKRWVTGVLLAGFVVALTLPVLGLLAGL